MKNLIIFHLISIILTIANCGKFSTTRKTNLKHKIKFKYWLIFIIGILFLFLIIILSILIYIRRRKTKRKHEKLKRKTKKYDIPFESYNNINELDTIQTVGIASDFTDNYTETEVKTII